MNTIDFRSFLELSPMRAVAIVSILTVCVTQSRAEDAMRARWRERDNKHQSFRVRWVTKETIGKESRSSFLSGRRRLLPSETVTFDGKGSLLVSGGRYRRERVVPNWSDKQERFVLEEASFTSDWNFYNVGGLPFPAATRLKESRTVGNQGFDIRPILMFYRPILSFGELVDIDFARHQKVSNGVDEFIVVNSGGSEPIEITLRPDWEYAPVRCVYRRNDELRWVVEIEYSRSENGEVRLKGWATSHFGPAQRLRDMTVASVEEFEVNPSVAEEDFEIALPPGTWVRDQRTKTEYVVRADGRRRTIERNERDVRNYDALLMTEPGESPYPAEDRSWRTRTAAGVAASGGVGLASVAILALWRRKRAIRVRKGVTKEASA